MDSEESHNGRQHNKHSKLVEALQRSAIPQAGTTSTTQSPSLKPKCKYASLYKHRIPLVPFRGIPPSPMRVRRSPSSSMRQNPLAKYVRRSRSIQAYQMFVLYIQRAATGRASPRYSEIRPWISEMYSSAENLHKPWADSPSSAS